MGLRLAGLQGIGADGYVATVNALDVLGAIVNSGSANNGRVYVDDALQVTGELYIPHGGSIKSSAEATTGWAITVGYDMAFRAAKQMLMSPGVYGSGADAALRYLKVAGAVYEPVTAKSADATLLVGEGGTILATSGGAGITLTLPAASGNAGLQYRVKKVDAAATAVTIDGNAAETIDGAATNAEIDAQYDELTIVCDGANWHIVASLPQVIRGIGADGYPETVDNMDILGDIVNSGGVNNGRVYVNDAFECTGDAYLASVCVYLANAQGRISRSADKLFVGSMSGDLALFPKAGSAVVLNSSPGHSHSVNIDECLRLPPVSVTKLYTSDLFDAAALTDSAVIWAQPAKSVVLSFKMVLDTKFTATGTVAFSGVAAALDQVTVGINGADTVLVEGTHWDRGASAEASALSLAAAIDALTGLTATSAAGTTVTVTADAGYTLTNLVDNVDGGAVMTAAFMSDLDVTVGNAVNNSGFMVQAMNLTSDVVLSTKYSTKGALWTLHQFYESLAGEDWTAYATAVGRNLSTLTAGQVRFLITYLQY